MATASFIAYPGWCVFVNTRPSGGYSAARLHVPFPSLHHHHICLSFAPIISPHHRRMRSSLRPPPIAPSPPYKSIFVHPSGHSPETPSSTSSSPTYPPPSPPSVSAPSVSLHPYPCLFSHVHSVVPPPSICVCFWSVRLIVLYSFSLEPKGRTHSACILSTRVFGGLDMYLATRGGEVPLEL